MCVCVCDSTILSITAHDSGIKTSIMKLCYGDENKNIHWPNCISFSVFVVCIKASDLPSVASSAPRIFQQRCLIKPFLRTTSPDTQGVRADVTFTLIPAGT